MSNFDIIFLESVDSTNLYAKNLLSKNLPKSNCLITAREQFAGKGSYGNVWLSETGKNITCSFVFFPEKLAVQNQFYISKLISVSVVNVLKRIVPEIKIKWPNDIYINNKKLGGLLIENSVSGSFITTCIIGLGLNINQTVFDYSLKSAVSVKLITEKNIDPAETAINIFEDFLLNLNLLYSENFGDLDRLYLENLALLNVFSNFEDKNGKFSGKIIGIDKLGKLIVEHSEGQIKKYDFKEIVFL